MFNKIKTTTYLKPVTIRAASFTDPAATWSDGRRATQQQVADMKTRFGGNRVSPLPQTGDHNLAGDKPGAAVISLPCRYRGRHLSVHRGPGVDQTGLHGRL